MTADPMEPGRGLPVYQPATAVVGGTWSAPLLVRPEVNERGGHPDGRDDQRDGLGDLGRPLRGGGLDRAGRRGQHRKRGRLRNVRVTGQRQAGGAGPGRDQAGRHQEHGRPPARRHPPAAGMPAAAPHPRRLIRYDSSATTARREPGACLPPPRAGTRRERRRRPPAAASSSPAPIAASHGSGRGRSCAAPSRRTRSPHRRPGRCRCRPRRAGRRSAGP